MKTIIENWKLYKVVEQKEEINIEEILKENEELRNKRSNTWYRNVWDYNIWDWNIWSRNVWNSNIWDYNIWYRNIWDNNIWDWNAWDNNLWTCNLWNWNTWDYNTWCFNIDTPKTIRCFWVEVDRGLWFKAYKPDWLYFNLTEWIYGKYMTDEEKEDNPTYKTTWWYLKKYDYKEAFKKSYDTASEEDIEAVKKLPWFNSDIFFEISWIRL